MQEKIKYFGWTIFVVDFFLALGWVLYGEIYNSLNPEANVNLVFIPLYFIISSLSALLVIKKHQKIGIIIFVILDSLLFFTSIKDFSLSLIIVFIYSYFKSICLAYLLIKSSLLVKRVADDSAIKNI